MNDEEKRKRNATVAVAINIGTPIAIAFLNPILGLMLLIIGIWFLTRYISILREDARRSYNETLGQHKANSAGKTILVQLVDDFERDLLPDEAEKRIAEAKAQAGPHDTVIPVKFKVDRQD